MLCLRHQSYARSIRGIDSEHVEVYLCGMVPSFGFGACGGVEFEWYDERCHSDKHDQIQIDIYIPVKDK